MIGAVGSYSLNYERILLNKSTFKLAISAGVSYFKWEGINIFSNPIGLEFMRSFEEHHFIAGLTNVIKFKDFEGNWPDITASLGSFLFSVSPTAGYRYQKPTGKFIFKAFVAPKFYYYPNYNSKLLGGVTFGYAF